MSKIVRKNIVFILTIMLAGMLFVQAGLAGQQEPQEGAESKRLLIATTDNGPVSIDRLLYVALRNINCNVEFFSPAIREGYIQANDGICDGVIAGYPELHTVYTDLRQVPIPLERINVRVFAKEGSELEINSWDELSGMRVGILENRTYILEMLPDDVAITERETNRAVLNGLLSGDYDAAVLVERDHEIIGEMLSIVPVGKVDTLYDYLYLNKKHESFIPHLTESLEKMLEDGSADTLLENIPLPELNQKKTIVHIISTSVEMSRQDRFTTQLRSHFEDDMSVEWITVNLDARRFTRGQHNMAFIASLLRADIVSRNISAVVVSGDTALDFLDEYYYLYFRNTPVLFYAVSEKYSEIIRDNEHQFTGIVQNIEALETVRQALRMFPGTDSIFVVNDYTDEGEQYRRAIEEGLADLSGSIDISYNENVDITSLLEQLSVLPENTIVLIGSYFVDADHQYYTMREMNRLLERNCSVPIFSLYSIDPAFNAVGGKVLNFQNLGDEIADMLTAILNGQSVMDIPVVHDSIGLNCWVFDQNQLDRFGISARQVPEGSLIVNKTLSLRESNPQYFAVLIILSVLSAVLITGAVLFYIINSRHSKIKDKLQQELTIEKTMLETVFNSVPELLYVKNLNGVFIRVNRRFEEHLGVTKEQVEGGHPSSVLKVPQELIDSIDAADRLALDEDRMVMIEMQIPGADGGSPYFEIIETPLANADQVLGVVGIAYNITHRREMEEAAQAASRAKTNFLANMSHEMRTPLTTVLGLTELTIETVQLDDETLSNLIKIYRAGETLLGLVNDVLDISKIEADKFTLNEHDYELPSLINDTITQCSLYIGEKPIKFILDIKEDLPNYLYGDDLRIRQIWNNLLSNAFKFTKEGTVEFGVRSERDGDTVWLTAYVRDTGIGIRDEDLDKLFTMYTKLEQEDSDSAIAGRRTEGTGLGLSITKRVSEMMNGSINVESKYGEGSTFTIRLMQKYVNDAVIGKETAENLKNYDYSFKKFENAKMTRINMSYARVLVVDDNPTNLDVARGLLSLYGITVDCVGSGQEAIDTIRGSNCKYNAIFMDHMMPEMDGIEATRIIREDIGREYAEEVPIIALTANAIVGNEEMFLGSGFKAYISKPIDLSKLDSVLRQWVRDKDAEAELPERTISIKTRGIDTMPYLRVPGVDIGKGLSHFGNNMDILSKMLLSYAKNTRPVLDSIKDGADPDNLKKFAVTVHGIKGASYGIFAEETGRMASMIEKAALAGDMKYISENHGRFIAVACQLIDDIEEAVGKGTSKPLKDKPDMEVLKTFLTACGSYDIDTMDKAMEEIDKWEYTDDGGLAEWLRSHLRQGKYKEIKAKLTELAG